MTSLLHPLHIGTLATWLSVAGFGTVAVVVPARPGPTAERPAQPEAQWLLEDITLGTESSPVLENPSTEPPAADLADSWPAPPEIPDLSPQAPLPEIPEMAPAPVSEAIVHAPSATAQAPRPTPKARPSRPAVRKPAAASTGVSSGNGTGLSSSARLAQGRMPPPDYPAEARRLGQTGTLVVEFTIDPSGRVISAYVKSPCPWPLLNEEAVNSVRRWKFPPGTLMKLQRPIIFQLR
jgi:protein TonB